MENKIGDEIEIFVLREFEKKEGEIETWKCNIKNEDFMLKLEIMKNKISSLLMVRNQKIVIDGVDYNFNKFIGEGSYGSVCEIENCETGEIRALKIFRSFAEAANEYKYYCKLEGCPFIPRIYSSNRYSIMMEKYKSDVNGKILSVNTILKISKCILESLKFMHKIDIVHGDVKVTNILMDDDRNGILCDFSNTYKRGTKLDEIGTIYFRSPENCSPYIGKDDFIIEPSADIWAFGVCFVSMFNQGKVPRIFRHNCPVTLYNLISNQVEVYDELESVFNVYVYNENYEYLLELCKMFLRVKPELRVSADDALKYIEENIKINELF